MQRIVVSLAILVALTLVSATSFAQTQKSLNQQVAQAIADKLSDKYPDYTINVRYNSGVATLVGELYSKEQADEAGSYVQSLPGVNKVINNLKIVQQQTQIQAVPVSSRLNGNHNAQPPVTETVVAQNTVSQPPAVPQPNQTGSVITQVSGQMRGVTDFSQQTPPAPAMAATPTLAAPPAPNVTAPTAPVPTLTPAPTMQASYVEGPQDQPMQESQGLSTYSPSGLMGGQQTFNGNSISSSPVSYPEAGYAPQASISTNMNGNMPLPMGQQAPTMGRYDNPNVPNYAWPTYAAPNNYSEVTYPRLYCPQAAPYIGPFYPYPQVPLEWRKVTLEWHDGYWWLDFDDGSNKGPFSPLFRQPNPKRY